MAQIPNLENSSLNLSALRDQSQKDLITLLANIRGRKCLVIEQKLGGSLSLILPTSLLKEHGTEIHHLSCDPIHTDCSKIVFLVPSQISLMKLVSSHVKADVSKGYHREYFLFFVPRRTVVCEKILEDEKVHHLMTIGEYPLYLVPLDEDVLSFELDLSAKECLVDGDMGSLWVIAKAIHKLEAAFGVIPNVSSKGKASVRVAELISHLQVEEPVNVSDMSYPEISTLILLDREVDMVTPMLSQLTYEGLLDEFLYVNNGSVELDASIMGGVQQEGKKVKVPLNSNDKLFKEIRDLNFEVVVQVLRQKAMSMKQDYTDISTMTQTVSELKDFVKKLNSLPEMTRHINLAQHLTKYSSKLSFLKRIDMEHTIVEAQNYDICFDYIEEMIHKQEPLISVLRLLVLFSVTNSGLPKKHFHYLRRELLHSYGFEHIVTLKNLEKAGLLKNQESRSEWPTIKNDLHLVVEDSDTMKPSDISYVYSGCAPLTIRLVQHVVRSGWRPIEQVLKLLPGPHSEMKRGAYQMGPSIPNTSSGIGEGRRSVVLIVFIGGVTFAEISALRFLTAQEGMGYDVIVATTKIVNGSSLLHSFMDTLG